ncbi:hypothetical protein M3Y97_00287200 [Aphelenchoides bicaudatus]|nr:hypothetical protein M3Y97_00287200 [Aphelenchoides bicaudatus]
MHKRPLFEKLCNAADRYEKHMQFDDIYYLYFNVDGQETVVVLNSIGAEHTGNREMSVRKSDAVLLTYASHNPHSFEELSSVVDDFTMRKKYPPVVLICNEDELIEDDNLSMTEQSSTSEGYESDNPGQIKRHHSMEKIRQSQEGLFITKDQGENFLKSLGPEARFISTPVSQFDGTEELIMELLRKLNTTRSTRRRRSTVVDSLKQITLPFQKSKKTREREESNSSTTSDHSPDSSISQSPVDQPSPQSSISSNVPQIEVQQPEETVFPRIKS